MPAPTSSPRPFLPPPPVFTEADKAEADWQAEVTEDVQGEASKFGQVLHCYPDPNSKNVGGCGWAACCG